MSEVAVYAVVNTPMDAIPDLSENQVIVFTDWMGRSPKEIEDQVTYPLSRKLQGLAGIKAVRAAPVVPASLASPKSRILTTPSVVIIRFAGLMSRCTMPFLCALPSPWATWEAMSTASSKGRGPRRMRWRQR